MATYELTNQAAEELQSTVTVTRSVETQIPLGVMLQEYNSLLEQRAQLDLDYAARVTATDTRLSELYDILLEIKTENDLTFELEEIE